MNGSLGVVPQPRSELLDAVAYLEQALTAAHGRRVWTEELRDHLGRLRDEFVAHVRGVEDEAGLYRDILRASPRLAYRVSRLSVEHDTISREIDEVLALAGDVPEDVPEDRDSWVDRVYQRARTLVRRLSRHRQREADLIYEAYETDIGGET
jgi:iron-sulfur cluster repair protein YtfE (RIC family)